MTSTAPEPPVGHGLPWKWLIWLPVLASVIGGVALLAIAHRHADQPLPEAVTRTGPVQYGRQVGIERAQALGVLGDARIDPATRAVALLLEGQGLPASVTLRLWHPTEAARDLSLTLVRGEDGVYRGDWPAQVQGLSPLLSASGWELPGRFDSSGKRIRFRP